MLLVCMVSLLPSQLHQISSQNLLLLLGRASSLQYDWVLALKYTKGPQLPCLLKGGVVDSGNVDADFNVVKNPGNQFAEEY